jgi:hypothetical protein
MTRTAVATDAFGSSLSANWTQINTAAGSISTSSGKVLGAGTFGFASGPAAYYNASSFSTEQYASIVLSAVTDLVSFNYSGGVICRASTDTDGNRDFYAAGIALFYSGGNPYTRVFRVNNAGLTDLYSDASVAWTNGDALSLEVTGTGATVTLTVCKNGAAIGGNFTIADTDANRLTTGRPGVFFTGTTNPLGDDFEAGDITSSASAIPVFMSQYRRRR